MTAGEQRGYGQLDNDMAEQLRAAGTPDEAGRIARENGLRDARDAEAWLGERGQPEPARLSAEPEAAREAEAAGREAGS